MFRNAQSDRDGEARGSYEAAGRSTTSPLKLMAILAHPDDESLGIGGTLARYAAEGIQTYLVTATRGERGWVGEPNANPGPRALGEIRERELRAAAAVLGIRHLDILDYVDGELDQADPVKVTAKLVDIVRRVRPDVVITFGPEGAFGHPDHIAISQLTTAALVWAADPGYVHQVRGARQHRVAKLYHKIWTAEEQAVFQAAFGEIVMPVDGDERRPMAWPEWAITARIDTAEQWRTCWRAIACHRSQLPAYDELLAMPEEQHRALWGNQGFYRAYSQVSGGRVREHDLFQGLRPAAALEPHEPDPGPEERTFAAALAGSG
jgi:LmbE family N-acetylglucosaminyl deacetylase